MSNEMVKKDEIKIGSDGIMLQDFNSMQRFCQAAVHSKMFKDLRDVSQAIMKVEYGMELGLKPITAMRNIYYFNGNFCLSASIINALAKRAGYKIHTIHRTKEKCVLQFYDKDGQCTGISEYTMEDAKIAGLSSRDTWRKFPKNMLYARALTAGCNMYCSEVFLGPVYTPEEIIESTSNTEVKDVQFLATMSESEPEHLPELPDHHKADESPIDYEEGIDAGYVEGYTEHISGSIQPTVEKLKGKISKKKSSRKKKEPVNEQPST